MSERVFGTGVRVKQLSFMIDRNSKEMHTGFYPMIRVDGQWLLIHDENAVGKAVNVPTYDEARILGKKILRQIKDEQKSRIRESPSSIPLEEEELGVATVSVKRLNALERLYDACKRRSDTMTKRFFITEVSSNAENEKYELMQVMESAWDDVENVLTELEKVAQ